MVAVRFLFLLLSLYVLLLMDSSTAQLPGFVSVDCGGNENFTDEIGLNWSPDSYILIGKTANISVANETRKQYKTLRYFPADNNKYCYTLSVVPRTRYLVRATFLYGDFDSNNVYPKFDISFGPTRWSTIVISDAGTIESQELIFLAADPTVSVCLSNATTGQPFISTLELRQFNGSIYSIIVVFFSSLSMLFINGSVQELRQQIYLVFAGSLLASVTAANSLAEWANEGGDPCLPAPWSWVQCSSDLQPRITSIKLSGKNLTGTIPVEFTKLDGLVELWLDNNSLSGSIPDFSGCPNLKKIHLEDNKLTGGLPSSLADLSNLRELYVQNNLLSGKVPPGLLNKDLVFNYTGNTGLRNEGNGGKHKGVVIGLSVGAAVLLLIAAIISFLIMSKRKKNSSKQGKFQHGFHAQKLTSSLSDTATEAAHYFPLFEIEEATKNFEKKIGSGGFGVVYYGILKDGREIAVKILTNDSFQGKREFSNEVSLLSRIHHRNLVQFLGYCQEDGKSILVYEFMHNGTLKEHLYGPLTHGRVINWIKRLEIAEDSAKGIEYLHTGCVPSIIHRDLKTSNILLDKNTRAKVSDFGLSKLAVDGASHVSSIVRGTVGYLDPEYYISQQLTDKSDVYSFGVILLELISGQEAISNENFGSNCRNIVQWAKLHIESGDIQGIIDPSLHDYDIQSMWKIAEKALMCVQPHGSMRPSISEVIKEIQDALAIEKGAENVREASSDEISRHSVHSSLNLGSLDIGASEHYLSIDDDSIAGPIAR
ncbi:PREDICTED: probable LRR receptor-like serine/threonine-protein kinase At1g67720 [Erythranthe guttata]|nr:PREDICTED: probable LRR receptor-like serine/threonine-protein kinase At1g67720 [Erythranthe guttata]|eukprot:XP_012831739.1 PREDICTED: probable LRR receptor-like serine/threonine-protein kinase At1g67720 [Erythranthe guttata]